jgi:hypothetical protein
MTKSVLFGAAALALTVTAVSAQQLTPFQSQVLGGIKKLLTEYTQQQHGNCTTPRVCDIGRVEVLDESWSTGRTPRRTANMLPK